VYFSGYYTESALLRSQAVQLGLTADYYGGNATDNADFIKIAGVKAAAGSYLIGLPTPEQLDYPESKKFAQDYVNRYKEKIPSIWVVVNADGLRVIFEAMRQTKSNNTEVVAKYIRSSIKDFNGLTGPITIQPNGERAGSIYQVNIINSKGEYEVWKPK
ncbi:MAG: ABC transporter substrate-binding protein, partial [Deferribacteraceae bacterium]|jgi:branched-chain amino acid transport system substrate-binding protein|nr:ABC transporter substrate-binding protein [Deferribacteraceae bacterium]